MNAQHRQMLAMAYAQSMGQYHNPDATATVGDTGTAAMMSLAGMPADPSIGAAALANFNTLNGADAHVAAAAAEAIRSIGGATAKRRSSGRGNQEPAAKPLLL